MEKKRFFALDSFRGLCALCVVIFHMKILNAFSEWDFFRNSRLFVEFFFILSGFVLTHSYLKKETNGFYKYAIARTFRIFPLHIFMLCVYVILESFKLVAQQKGFVFNTPPFQGGNSLKEFLPNLLLIQSWSSSFEYLSFNYPSWSISVEYYLYFIFYLVICPRTIIGRVFAGIVFFIIFLFQEYSSFKIFTSEVIRGGICFGAGILVYYLYSLIHLSHATRFLSVVFTILESSSLALIWFVVSMTDYESELLVVVVFSSSVFLFAFELGMISFFLKKKPFQFFGKLSYSIYLTHASVLFVLISAMMVLQKITGVAFTQHIDNLRYLNFGSSLINNFMIFAVLGCVIFFSMLTYKFIELPAQRKGKELYEHYSK
ncbi:acyltransferase [Escherichia albertii]|uniref:O-acetyltransferase n=1 Tax=Shigella boydii TaxID=621 RepID=Q6UJ84_SHIBO|nr:O-acetyltransferase [Shigella boydii]EFG1229165.1 acyltransferase [Escherichia albertii]EFZ2303323.1 acyltransferase [Shigella boydii]EFZ6324313.1 acyltransferase [Shigella boydii]EFZ8837383.1 acyltransferase [Shigella boydii]